MKPDDGQRCENCRFFGPMEDCRRRSPVPMPTSVRVYGEWPITAKTSWCGEWKRGLTLEDPK